MKLEKNPKCTAEVLKLRQEVSIIFAPTEHAPWQTKSIVELVHQSGPSEALKCFLFSSGYRRGEIAKLNINY